MSDYDENEYNEELSNHDFEQYSLSVCCNCLGEFDNTTVEQFDMGYCKSCAIHLWEELEEEYQKSTNCDEEGEEMKEKKEEEK